MAQNVTIAGASYPDVPSVVLPKTGGGYAEFVDATTVVQSNWDENDNTSLAYIQNRPFYEGTPDPNTLEGTGSGTMWMFSLTNTTGDITLVEGDTYILSSNGTELTAKCFRMNGTFSFDYQGMQVDETYSDQLVLGDEEWVNNGATTGAMFISASSSPKTNYLGASGSALLSWGYSGATVTIEHSTIKQIDPKFLPVAEVALSGSYTDLTDKPTIPSTHETWTFTLSDNTTVTKEVMLWQ